MTTRRDFLTISAAGVTAATAGCVSSVRSTVGGSESQQRNEKPDSAVQGFVARRHSQGNLSVPYRLFAPEQGGGPHPIVFSLHGSGARGSDNTSQIRNDSEFFANDEAQSRFPTFVVAPQCPEGKSWVQVDGWDDGVHPQRPITQPMEGAKAILDRVVANNPIDKNRQYVTGFSMGGYGTWDAITRWPDRFAAALPMSGGGIPNLAGTLEDVRVWGFHGSGDETVPTSGTKKMIAAMEQEGLSPRATIFDGGHTCDPALNTDGLAEWLFSGGLAE